MLVYIAFSKNALDSKAVLSFTVKNNHNNNFFFSVFKFLEHYPLLLSTIAPRKQVQL